MATARETAFDGEVVPAAKKINRYIDRPLTKIADLVWGVRLPIPGFSGTTRPAATILAYVDHNVNKGFAEQKAILTGLVGAIAALNKGEAFDEAKLLVSIKEAARLGAEQGVADAIKKEGTA